MAVPGGRSLAEECEEVSIRPLKPYKIHISDTGSQLVVVINNYDFLHPGVQAKQENAVHAISKITQKAKSEIISRCTIPTPSISVSKTAKHGYQKRRSQCIEVQKSKKEQYLPM